MTDFTVTAAAVDAAMFPNQSVLDQGLSYPADMSALPTSTPNTVRRKRRSWFETTPKGMKFDIAVEKPSTRQPVRRPSEDIETLTLTHFTAPPRLGFGSLKPGLVKTCTLLLRNPHEYAQSVSVEKVPEKKHFSVSCRSFSVGPGETYPLDVTWAPQDVGNFREMILLQIDQAYRLQAYVFGSVLPHPQKKRLRKGGLLATKASARPKGRVEKDKVAKKAPSENVENLNPVPGNINHKPGNKLPSQRFPRKPMTEGRMGSENNIPSKTETDSGVVRKKMRRSDTYSNVSGLGLTVPIIKGDTVQGHKDTSLLVAGTCNISGLQVIDISPIKPGSSDRLGTSIVETEANTDTDRPGVVQSKLGPDVNDQRLVNCPETLEPSFLEAPDQGTINSSSIVVGNGKREPSFLGPDIIPSDAHQISTIKAEHSIQDSLESSELQVNHHTTELPSFLMNDNSHVVMTPKLRRSARKRSGKLDVVEEKSAEVKLIRGIKRRKSGRQIVSPDSFVKEMYGKNKYDNTGNASCHKPLNDSIGQSSVLEQLKSIKSFIHEKSFEIEQKSNDSFSTEKTDCLSELKPRETLVRKRRSPRLNKISVEGDNCPGSCVPNATKLKLLATQKPSCASPRRTTFTVKEGPKANPLTRSRSEGSPALSTVPADANIDIKELDPDKIIKNRENFNQAEVVSAEDGTNSEAFVPNRKKMDLLATQKPSCASPRRTTFIVQGGPKTSAPVRSRSEGGSALQSIPTEKDEGNQLESELNDKKSQATIGHALRVDNVQRPTGKSLQRMFSADSLENGPDSDVSPKSISADSLEDEVFDKVSKLPSHHTEAAEDFTRRATLTVTKSRPSDALLEHAHRSGMPVALFLSSPTHDQQCVSQTNSISQPGEVHTNNSTFELTAGEERSGALQSSFTTPQQLPASPKPDLSRRSTHVMDKPKVLDISKLDRKQLFCESEDQIDNLDDPQAVVKDDEVVEEPDANHGHSELIAASGNFSSNKIKTKNSKCKIDKNENHEDWEILDKEAHTVRDVKCEATASLDLQKQCGELSTGSSMDKSTDSTKLAMNRDKKSDCLQSMPDRGLVFIPVQDKLVSKQVTTTRKDPKQFLKKRSNPVTQAEDCRAKRLKSEMTAHDKGKAITQPAASTRITRQTTRKIEKSSSENRTVLKPKSSMVKGLAQSKLILTKKSKSALPKHPLPFAAKNMYYDERWMEKQERGFVNWLNFILTPADEYNTNNVKVKVDAGKLSMEMGRGSLKLAPTNEALSLRAYSAHRRLNHLRRAACRLFQSESVIRVIQKIESEVESGRLAVRKDRMLHADLGAKQTILDLLLSYNPLWLRIGLETMYGEVVPLQTNTDVFGLSRFIVTRLLSSPDIAEEYAHPTVPHLYRDGYAEASARHTLKRFLILVYFLDRGKQERLLDHNPCLFCKDSEVKASKDVLIQFSRDFLSGEGDITRHLTYLGYKTTYMQTALDEFDYAVSKLSCDLRDGLRLTRVLEFLCSRTDLSSTLRVPAISRLQKIHNVEVVMKTLTSQGVDTGGVTARDVVDGHREKTLHLLWCIILHYQVALLVNEDQLREEISILRDSLRVRHQIHKLRTHQNQPTDDSKQPALHTQNDKLDLVLKWCKAVCAFYNIQVENFTVSFSDGRALCHIVHHYHPGLLPVDRIHTETTVTHLENTERNLMSDGSSSSNISDSSDTATVFTGAQDPEVFDHLLNNERENFRLLSEKVRELGGIPLMLRWTDMSNTIPDEKVVITYVLYLCARLLDIRHESRAACTIQRAWRKHYLRKLQEQNKVQNRAALTIQQHVRNFLQRQHHKRREAAAVIIQRVWRGHRGRRQASLIRREKELHRQTEAVTLLQVAVKRYVHRRRYLHMRSTIGLLQAYCRGYLWRKRRMSAAITIQRMYRGHIVRRCLAKEYRAAIVIQASVRGHLARSALRQQLSAAVVIQRWYRATLQMRKYRQDFLQLQRSCIMIQQAWRRFVTMREQQKTRAVVRIQAALRGFLVRREYVRMQAAAVRIQACYRGWRERARLSQYRMAAMQIQQRYREHLVTRQQRAAYQHLRKAVIFMQSQRRMITSQREYRRTVNSITLAQACARMIIARRMFQRKRMAAVVIQTRFRAMILCKQERYAFLVQKGAALTIQATFKGYCVRKDLQRQAGAASLIQRQVRAFQCRRKFESLKQAVIVCQRRYRAKCQGQQQCAAFTALRQATIIAQKTFRGKQCRKAFLEDKRRVIKGQAFVRMILVRQSYLRLKFAAAVVQERFRAKRSAQFTRQQFVETKAAVVRIQAGYRGYRVRKHIQKQNQAAVAIQAALRGTIARKWFVHLKAAAMICQKRYRAKAVGMHCRQEFLQKKHAAIQLQSAYRGYTCRKRYQLVCQSVIRMQATVRGHQQRKRYEKLRKAVMIVQRMRRDLIVSRRQREAFLKIRQAAMVIQSAWRMMIQRRKFVVHRESAVIVQSHFRRFIAERKFKKLKTTVVTMQRLLRANMFATQCRREFLIQKGATLTIQAVFRGHVVRKALRHRNQCAIRIQALYKGHKQRRAFLNLKQASIACQRRYRANMIMHRAQDQYEKVRRGVILLQAAFRGKHCRQELQRVTQAVVQIQSLVRMRIARDHYMRWKRAAIVLQTLYRSLQVMRADRGLFLAKKQAAVVVQAYTRGMLARKLARQLQAVIRMQSFVRMILARKRYLTARANVITCQATVRRYLAQKRYENLKRKTHAACVIQSKWQALKLGREQRKQFMQLKQHVTMIQGRVRALQKMNRCRRDFLIHKGAAITVQACVRGYLVRIRVRKENDAARRIQETFRAVCKRKTFLNLKQSAIVCQRMIRAKTTGRSQRKQFELIRAAAICIQSSYRGHRCQVQFRAARNSAVTIQAAFRAYSARKHYLSLKKSATVCQRLVRAKRIGKAEREKFVSLKLAAICIQSHYRSHQCQSQLKLAKQSAVRIQAAFRAYSCRKQFESLKSSTVICQRLTRARNLGKLEREKFLRMKCAAICIQSHYRSHRCQSQFKLAKQSAVRIQAAFRAYSCRKQFESLKSSTVTCQRLIKARNLGKVKREKFLRIRCAALCIQSHYRRYQCQLHFSKLRQNCIRIQSWFRGIRERRNYLRLCHASTVLQTHWRAELACRSQVMAYKALQEAALMLQSLYRGHVARQMYAKMKAAVIIQKFFRMRRDRLRYIAVQQATSTIQAAVRGWLARQYADKLRAEHKERRQKYLDRFTEVSRLNLAAIVIQRCYRNYLLRKEVQEKLDSVVTIQRWMKAKLQRLHYLSDRTKIVRLQGHVRSWLIKRDKAARVIQAAARQWLRGRGDRRRNLAAVQIQAVWRGYHIRKTSNSKKLANVRQKVMAATASATDDNKLCNRTTSALDYLLKYKHLSQVLDALMHLECFSIVNSIRGVKQSNVFNSTFTELFGQLLDVATRLSGVCCERLVEANAICVLYRLMKGCNRSLPHMELIKYTLNILLNLAKYETTRASVYDVEDGLATILELMQIYREKLPLFTRTCTLLGILALDAPCKQMVLQDVKCVERIRSIHMLTSRKHKLESSQRMTRARMNATMNTTYLVSSPVKKHKIKPDWSLHKDKMADIECPLKAINFVLKNLGIPAK